MAKKTTPGSSLWDDDQLAEQPAKRSAAVAMSERHQRWVRKYTIVSLFAMPVCGIMLMAIWSEMGTPAETPTVTVTNQVDSEGKAAAILAVNKWLDAVPAPIVGGQVVAWNGFDEKQSKKVPEKLTRVVSNPVYDIEVHHFTLVDAQGINYTSDVAVAVDEVNGAVVIGSPSLSPVAPSATGWAGDGTWYGLRNESSTEPMMVAVNQWAKAFTSGDPDVLRATVGDPDASHSYMPLVGVTDVKPTFVKAGSVPVLNSDGLPSDDPAKEVIAQVQLQLTWADGGNPGVGETKGNSLVTYDLLIQGAATAAPVVVAWDGAGSGTTLEPYSQAVVDRSLTKETN